MKIKNIPLINTDVKIESPDGTPDGSPNNISTGKDDGTILCVGDAFGWTNKHNTFQKCVINALKVVHTFKQFNIIGHGNEGYVETGWGQRGNPDPLTNYMATTNFVHWEPHIKRLNTNILPNKLRMFGCYVGAGQKGADFLFQIAKTTGKTVVGFNALMTCDGWGVHKDKRGVWVEATPTKKPTPVEQPSVVFDNDNNSSKINISIKKVISQIDINAFKEIEVKSFNEQNGTSSVRNIESKLIKESIITMFATDPYTLQGKPLAIITATVKFIINTKYGLIKQKYTIYSDKIMVSEDGDFAHYVRENIRDFY